MPLKLRKPIKVHTLSLKRLVEMGELLDLQSNLPKVEGLYLLFTRDLAPSTVLRVYQQAVNNGRMVYCVGHFSSFTAKPNFNGYYWSEPIPHLTRKRGKR